MTRKAKTNIVFNGVLPNGQQIEAKMLVEGVWYSGCMATLECPAEDPEINYQSVKALNFPQEYAENMLEQWESVNGVIDETDAVEWEIEGLY
jgi:hypothetical protein